MTMTEKIKALLNSIRFWEITLGTLAGYLADVAKYGFDTPRLLVAISIWLTAVMSIGTFDSVAQKLAGK